MKRFFVLALGLACCAFVAAGCSDEEGTNGTTGNTGNTGNTGGGTLTLVITSPQADAVIENGRTLTVSGTASVEDGDTIAKIELSLNGGAWLPATAGTSWSGSVRLAIETNNAVQARLTTGNGKTATATVAVSHAIVPVLVIDGVMESAWNGAAFFHDTLDNTGSVPAEPVQQSYNLTNLYLTNDGYFLYAGWSLVTNYMDSRAIWYLAIETGASGGGTEMAAFYQPALSSNTRWSGPLAPDLMVYFKYKDTANAGLNGFWVQSATTPDPVHAWDTSGAVVDHINQWAEARIPLASLGLSNNQVIHCWLAVSKHDVNRRAFLDSVPRLGDEWPYGGSWSVNAPNKQDLTSAWASYTLRGVELD